MLSSAAGSTSGGSDTVNSPGSTVRCATHCCSFGAGWDMTCNTGPTCGTREFRTGRRGCRPSQRRTGEAPVVAARPRVRHAPPYRQGLLHHHRRRAAAFRAALVVVAQLMPGLVIEHVLPVDREGH